jgi:hypothetical protein
MVMKDPKRWKVTTQYQEHQEEPQSDDHGLYILFYYEHKIVRKIRLSFVR